MELTSEIKTARRQLYSIDGYELLDDLTWNQKLSLWIMKIKLNVTVEESKFIPPGSVWHVAISDNYPSGTIKFYPDKDEGIKSTHPHQNYNHTTIAGLPFLEGDPCLNTKQGAWGRNVYSSEPKDVGRLKWHVERCIEWIKSAADETLFVDGDPFELPPFPALTDYLLVFNENERSFSKWASSSVTSGLVEIKSLDQKPRVYAVFNFLGHEKDEPATKWGLRISKTEQTEHHGVWLTIPELPVEKPWRIPTTIGELVEVLESQGIDLKEIVLKHFLSLRRKGNFLSFIMLGFPIPKQVVGSKTLMHWIGFELIGYPGSKGFTKNSQLLFKHELNVILSNSKKIKWVKTENWHEDQITRRGQIPERISDSKILLIGCGAVGSILSDQLIRLKCKNVTIIDGEKSHIGNMSRHELLFTDVENYKAEALAMKLNATFPFVNATFENETLQAVLFKNPEFLNEYDIIIEATGNDSVLELLSTKASDLEGKNLISISTGYNAERLYLLRYKGAINEKSFKDVFDLNFENWHESERESLTGSEELTDGIGCWHPLLPARIDDLHMHIGAAIKLMEKSLISDTKNAFYAIEKTYDVNEDFTGLMVTRKDDI